MKRRGGRRWLAVAAVAALLLGTGLIVAGPVRAQDATVTPTGPGTGDLPVAIHSGTCANPTIQPAYQLGNLAPFGGASTTATASSSAGGVPVMTVQKTIDVKIDDLITSKQPHALILHESAAHYTHYLACADLTGLRSSDDFTVVVLRPTSGSNWYGIATLAGSKSVPVVGSNRTQITVYLFQTQTGAGTPATGSTPAA